MVDVVNSSLANAVILRNGGDTSASRAVQPSVIDQAVASGAPETPQAPYISPYITIDFDYDKAVLQIRDADTGDVQEQFPTNSRLAQQRRAQAQLEQASQVSSAKLEPIETKPKESTQPPQAAPTSPDVITVQDVASAPPANAPQFSPQIAVAALSAASQSGGAASQTNVSVQA
ncbi:MAG: hypothetical protein ACRBDI_02860 [Alphaproteobacteria bacterium]